MAGQKMKNQESCEARENSGAQKKDRPKERQKKGAGIWRLAMFVSVAVFALSLWQLSEILIGYYTAISSYDDIAAHMGQETAPAPPRAEIPEDRDEPGQEPDSKDRDNRKTDRKSVV